jgi:hypothetical protein
MQQVSQLHPQEGRLRAQMSRLMHSRRAAWWIGLLSMTGLTQFLGLLAIGMCVAGYEVIVHNQQKLSNDQVLLVLALSVFVALAVTVHAYRTTKDDDLLKPPKERVPRKRWRIHANFFGAIVAIGAAYTTWWLWTLLLFALLMAATLVVSLPTWTADVFLYLTIPVPLVLMLWAFIAWRHVALTVLETTQPPELHLATNLIRYADEFQERAKALEKAMEEAAAISQQVQRGIELEQQQLGELREEYLQQVRLNDLTAEEVSAVRSAIAQEHERSTRWGLLWNLVIAVVFLAVGLVMQALIDLDALGDQLRQWLHLG